MEIQESLIEMHYAVNAVSVVDIHRLKRAPQTEQLFDIEFRHSFLADNPKIEEALSTADAVAVNGEGTLHGRRQPARNLLYVSHLAKTVFEKPVHAINMSLFPEGADPPDEQVDQLYTRLLEPLDRVVVREPRSFDVAKRLGLKAVLGFDCLPRYLGRAGYEPTSGSNGAIVLGGGLGIDPYSFAKTVEAIATVAGMRPLHYVTGAKGHPASDDAKILDVLLETCPSVIDTNACTFDEWAQIIGDAACLVSGRFHHTIAAAFLGTPAIPFRASTPKLDGLCQALMISAPLDPSQSESIEQVVQFVRAALAGKASTLTEDLRSCLIANAAHNFDGF